MSKKHLKKGELYTPPKEFTAQNWLFRELLDKMKRNNVKRVLLYTEDADGNQHCQEWCMPKNKKKMFDFISSY